MTSNNPAAGLMNRQSDSRELNIQNMLRVIETDDEQTQAGTLKDKLIKDVQTPKTHTGDM